MFYQYIYISVFGQVYTQRNVFKLLSSYNLSCLMFQLNTFDLQHYKLVTIYVTCNKAKDDYKDTDSICYLNSMLNQNTNTQE